MQQFCSAVELKIQPGSWYYKVELKCEMLLSLGEQFFLVCPPPQELTEVTDRIAVKLLGIHRLARGHSSSMIASQREHLNFKPPAEGAPLLTTMSTC